MDFNSLEIPFDLDQKTAYPQRDISLPSLSPNGGVWEGSMLP
jgi:hypothetical protein